MTAERPQIPPPGYREGVTYLQVEPRGRFPYSATVTRATTQRPTRPLPGAVVVKVRIRLPKAVFEPLQPEAILTVPENLATHPVVEVTAEDPGAVADGDSDL